jgi:MIP family channel proteins
LSTLTPSSTLPPQIATAKLTVASAAAELIGTFVLVFAITATASAAGLGRALAGVPYGSLSIVVVNGITLCALVAALGRCSGAHLNPAVTVALAGIRRFPWRAVPAYLMAQLAGGILAGLATWVVLSDRARQTTHLGATAPGAGVGDGRALLTEFFITFILVLVVIAVTDERANPVLAPPAIGAALATAVFIGGPVTGAAANPARALGPMIAAGSFTGWWIFIIGPVLGGLLAAGVHELIVRWAEPPNR